MADAEGQPPPHPQPHPTEIGGYRIQRVIGTGGMATVFAAMQKQPRRIIALKVMHGGPRADAAMRRFKREIEILGKLQHPNIAHVFEAGVQESSTGTTAGTGGGMVPWFTMEYIDGARTILEYASEKQLSLEQKLKLFVHVCAAVGHGHQRRVIHRDLKPSNILINREGQPKVIDFGIARAAEIEVAEQTEVTEAGRLVGTVQYMAPEQVDAQMRDVDARCDVYALGVILYKLLTGRWPYDLDGLPLLKAMQIIREAEPAKPSTLRGELRGDIETILLKAIEKEPRKRYRDAASFGRDILRYLNKLPIRARRSSVAYRATLFAKRHRTLIIAGGVVVLVMSIAAAIVIFARDSSRPSSQRGTVVVNTDSNEPAPDDLLPLDASGLAVRPDARPLVGGFGGSFDGAAPSRRIVSWKVDDATVASLGFDPAGRRLACGTKGEHRVFMYDMDRRKETVATDDHNAAVTAIAFARNGEFVISADAGGDVVVVNALTGRFIKRMTHDAGAASAIAVGAIPDQFAVACSNLTLRVWNDLDAPPRVLRSMTGALQGVAFSPSGALVAAGSTQGQVYVWDANTGDTKHRLDVERREIIGLTFVEGDDRLFVVVRDGGALFFDLALSWQPPRKFELHRSEISAVAFDGSGTTLAAACREGLVLFDLRTMQHLGEVIEGVGAGAVAAIAIDSNRRWCSIAQGTNLVDLVPLAAPHGR